MSGFLVIPAALENLQAQMEQGFGPFRPPGWDSGQMLFSIEGTLPGASASTTYFFDAVLRAEHVHSLRKTEQPVQSGASIADHAFDLPKRLIVDIGMSDAMASFKDGQWTDAATKSISAFQTLSDLKSSRVLLAVTTRLFNYENMLVEDVRAVDTARTAHGLRALVVFSEALTGIVEQNPASSSGETSARPQQNGETNQGAVTGQSLDAGTQKALDMLRNFNTPAPISNPGP